jgi:hypothetical protein
MLSANVLPVSVTSPSLQQGLAKPSVQGGCPFLQLSDLAQNVATSDSLKGAHNEVSFTKIFHNKAAPASFGR